MRSKARLVPLFLRNSKAQKSYFLFVSRLISRRTRDLHITALNLLSRFPASEGFRGAEKPKCVVITLSSLGGVDKVIARAGKMISIGWTFEI